MNTHVLRLPSAIILSGFLLLTTTFAFANSKFGTKGYVFFDFGGYFEFPNSIFIDPLGNLLVSGASIKNDSSFSFRGAVGSLSSDGSPNSSFGKNGHQTFSFRDLFVTSGLVKQKDGKILVSGMFSVGEDYDFGLIRLNTDGSLDSTFAKKGYVTTDIDINTQDIVAAIALQSDGKIILAGSAIDDQGRGDIALVRYLPDGNLDDKFGNGGRVITDIDKSSETVSRLRIFDDGTLLVSGSSQKDSVLRPMLVRYLPDGKVDISFGINGFLVGNSFADDFAAIPQAQRDSKILLFRSVTTDGKTVSCEITRLHKNGTLDLSFGVFGRAESPLSCGGTQLQAVDAEDRIVTAADVVVKKKRVLMLHRLTADGRNDPTFGNDGLAEFPDGDLTMNVTALRVQPDGKPVVAGSALVGQLQSQVRKVLVARFDEFGKLDR